MSAESNLRFLRQLQLLLDEGLFVSTYKYALLQALADLSVEQDPGPDGSLWLAVSDIAEKFIEYYWRQALPFGAVAQPLLQNNGRQAGILNYIVTAQSGTPSGTVAALRLDAQAWAGLRNSVARVIRQMPLWKLQTVAGEAGEFLYQQAEFRDDRIRLLPGVPAAFRNFYGLVANLVRGAWVAQVQSIPGNREVLGETASLETFLFGADRAGLAPYRQILRDHQSGHCFYCGFPVTGSGDLDHFIPWSRYPVDLGHNFVFSHSECNQDKREYLAHPDHLHRWRVKNLDGGDELASKFTAARLPHDRERSRRIAAWAYGQGELAGAHAWVEGKRVTVLDSAWRAALCVEEQAIAAAEATESRQVLLDSPEDRNLFDCRMLSPLAARLTEKLTNDAALQSPHEVLARPCPVPAVAGLYAWYFRDLPNVPLCKLPPTGPFQLGYIGIAPSKPDSRATLRSRLRQHFRGNAAGSTLRFTLGCLLAGLLGLQLQIAGRTKRLTWGKAGEQALSEWLNRSACVVWVVCPEPWLVEAELVQYFAPPLNLEHNGGHPFRRELTALRRQHRNSVTV